jgi:hypothetical protein
MDTQEYTFEHEGTNYTIQIGPSTTKLIIDEDPVTGLPQEYRLKYFICEEESKNISVMFASTILTPTGSKIEEKHINWTLTPEDYMFFEVGVGIPAIKPSLINGLLSYGLKLPKFFQIGDEPATEELGTTSPPAEEPAAEEPAAEEPAAEEPAAEEPTTTK